jgi:hypothetical protein
VVAVLAGLHLLRRQSPDDVDHFPARQLLDLVLCSRFYAGSASAGSHGRKSRQKLS